MTTCTRGYYDYLQNQPVTYDYWHDRVLAPLPGTILVSHYLPREARTPDLEVNSLTL